MNKTELMALLKDLQKAKEGSSELDGRCLMAVELPFGQLETVQIQGQSYKRIVWYDKNGNRLKRESQFAPRPSCDTQDALDCMVPEGWYVPNLSTTDPCNIEFREARAYLRANWSHEQHRFIFEGKGKTRPLAICIARLKQLIGECDEVQY